LKRYLYFLGLLAFGYHPAVASNTDPYQRSVANVVAIDQLGRTFTAGGAIKKNKRYVGIFYFTWLGQHPESQTGNFDISILYRNNPTALFDRKGTPASPLNRYHFWGEPLYGYYDSTDPWIIMRHLELLTMAGIDYLMLDATNAYFYPKVVSKLLSQLQMLQKQGWAVPKLAFYTNSSSGTTVKHIYQSFYAEGNYADLWFKPNGKPLIVGITPANNNASDQVTGGNFKDFIPSELNTFFDVRESQWPTARYNPMAFPWISWDYPQRIHNQMLSVSIAQHSRKNIVFSDTINTQGRGYDALLKQNIKSGITSGLNFQNQWQTVFANEATVNNVFVTGWNEWVAIKSADANKTFFVDCFNEEFSRDIEMMKGGYGDNYYLQLIKNIKQFKYDAPTKNTVQQKTINIFDKSLAQWQDVSAHYKDFEGDALPRNYKDFSGTGTYTDASNRNDITDLKIVNDQKNLYILVQTSKPITAHNGSDLNWMNVFIGTTKQSPHFGGFNYLINRHPGKQTTSLERAQGGDQWKAAGKISYAIVNNIMQISIPLKAIGQKAGNIALTLKVADHVTDYANIMDYYVSGDSAPIGRLGFLYTN
jgi:hypothetical protein